TEETVFQEAKALDHAVTGITHPGQQLRNSKLIEIVSRWPILFKINNSNPASWLKVPAERLQIGRTVVNMMERITDQDQVDLFGNPRIILSSLDRFNIIEAFTSRAFFNMSQQHTIDVDGINCSGTTHFAGYGTREKA